MNSLITFLKKIFGFKKDTTKTEVEYNNNTNQETDKQKFEKAMKFVRVVEGGVFDHPNDPGGFTNMGLTQRDYPDLDLKNLTRKQADEIFYKDYWSKSAAPLLPFPVYISYFDTVVNTGVGRANKILQKVVEVKQDGKVGPQTQQAVKNYKDYKQLALDLADGRQKFYETLVKQNKKFKSFIRGWTRRTNALKQYINTDNFTW